MAFKGKEVGDGTLDVPSDQACVDVVSPKNGGFQLNDLVMTMALKVPCKSKDTPVSLTEEEELKHPGSFMSGDSQDPWQEIVDYRRRLAGMLHKQNYEDGDRLSPEDEKVVCEVLKYHKKCEEKTGSGIDYIKIQKVYDYTTRCFWVVHVDGTEIDFSYHKCLKEKAAEECPEMLDHYDTQFRPYRVAEQATSATKRTTVLDAKTRHKYRSFS